MASISKPGPHRAFFIPTGAPDAFTLPNALQPVVGRLDQGTNRPARHRRGQAAARERRASQRPGNRGPLQRSAWRAAAQRRLQAEAADGAPRPETEGRGARRRNRMSIPVKTRKCFTIGKYEVIAEPIPYAMHMLRYNVFLDKKRIGATVSMPSESDCLFLEKPPVVPALKIFYLTSRPGRPKKGAAPAAVTL